MNNPEILATLGRQDTWRRKIEQQQQNNNKNTTQKTKQTSNTDRTKKPRMNLDWELHISLQFNIEHITSVSEWVIVGLCQVTSALGLIFVVLSHVTGHMWTCRSPRTYCPDSEQTRLALINAACVVENKQILF
jgi:hypothetical protein